MVKRLNNSKGISTRHNPSVRIKDSTAGITLIAFIITIIVLIILARNNNTDAIWRKSE